MSCMIEIRKYIMLLFQNTTQIVKVKIFLMIPNGEEWHYIALEKVFETIKRNIVNT